MSASALSPRLRLVRKIVLIGGSRIAAIAVVAIAGIYGVSAWKMSARHAVVGPALRVTPAASMAAEGGRLAHAHGCHGDNLGGHLFVDRFYIGRLSAPNLTRIMPHYSESADRRRHPRGSARRWHRRRVHALARAGQACPRRRRRDDRPFPHARTALRCGAGPELRPLPRSSLQVRFPSNPPSSIAASSVRRNAPQRSAPISQERRAPCATATISTARRERNRPTSSRSCPPTRWPSSRRCCRRASPSVDA